MLFSLRKRRTILVILATLIILTSAFSLITYSFTAVGSPDGTCPWLHFGSGIAPNSSAPFRLVDSRRAAWRPAENFYSGSGTVSWCVYSNDTLALQSTIPTNRLLGSAVVSGDGRYVVATGYQILPGPAGAYANTAVYLLDSNAHVLWNYTSSELYFVATTNHNASVVLAYGGSELAYLDHDGNLLWKAKSWNAAALVQDGAEVVTGTLSPTGLTMYNSKGQSLWNYTDPVSTEMFVSTRSIAASDGHIAAGMSSSGESGSLYYLDLSGNLIWSRHVNDAVLNVSFVQNGTQILVLGNTGTKTYDLNGNPA